MRVVKFQCPTCGSTASFPALYSETVASCVDCGERLERLEEKRRHGSPAKKRSMEQERRAAKRYGMDVQPGSGAMDHAKGDLVKKGKRRGECKYTTKKSYSLKLEILQKMEREAEAGELPFMEIEFQGVQPYRRFVVLPAHEFARLLEMCDGDIDD